jgi:hypothetical protein
MKVRIFPEKMADVLARTRALLTAVFTVFLRPSKQVLGEYID